MKTNSYLKNAFLHFHLIAFVLTFSFMSCQKDSLQELSPKGLEVPAFQSSLALEKLILEINFQVATDELTDKQILQQYTDLMGQISEEDRTLLIDIVQTSLAQEYDYAEGHEITSRSSESILSAGIPNDFFGVGVTTVGNKVYVGASRIQKVFEYAKIGGSYTLLNEITPDPANVNFGGTVSVSGSWMAVGAPGGENGKVYMYQKQGNAWVQKAILSGPTENFNFGTTKGLSLQGNTLAVHSFISAVPLVSTISVFTLSGNIWSLEQEIVQPGYRHASMKLDAGENRIVTVSGLNNIFTLPKSFIYVKDGSTWTLEDEVTIDIPGVLAALDVAIEGNTILLSAVFPGTRHFTLTNSGGDWEVSQELVTPASQPGSPRLVEMDGQKLIIGVSTTNNTYADEVHVFENNGATWVLTETITPSDLGVDSRMVCVEMEGNTIIAGSIGIIGLAGKAYVFD